VPNGAVARLSLVSPDDRTGLPDGGAHTLPTAIELPASSSPTSPSREVEIALGKQSAEFERALRDAVANFAVLSICANVEFRDGGLTPATKNKAGDATARLFELWSSIGEREFSILVLRQGAEELRAIGISDELGDRVLNWLLRWVLPKLAAAVRASN
jgi:hypothetical protein